MLFLFIKGASLFRCVQPELHSGKQTQAQGVQDRIDFLTEIQLIYNVVLVSGVYQCFSIHIYIYILFRFFPIILYYKILNLILCAI